MILLSHIGFLASLIHGNKNQMARAHLARPDRRPSRDAGRGGAVGMLSKQGGRRYGDSHP